MLEYETLTGEEITNVLKGIAPKRDDATEPLLAGPAVSVPLTHIGGAEPEPA